MVRVDCYAMSSDLEIIEVAACRDDASFSPREAGFTFRRISWFIMLACNAKNDLIGHDHIADVETADRHRGAGEIRSCPVLGFQAAGQVRLRRIKGDQAVVKFPLSCRAGAACGG